MIELNNVVKTYKSRKSTDTLALDTISLRLNDTGLTFIVGSSGSGKTTLLNLLGGLDKTDVGSIIVDGKDLSKMKEMQLVNYRNSYVGFIFQDYNIFEEYNLEENISLALELQGKSIGEKVSDVIYELGLRGLEKRDINELSGGQKQRVAIARAIVKEPKLILADEPTGNLDSKNSAQIIELLRDLSKDRLVVVVSHNKGLAEKYADRIIEINDGRVINDSDPYVIGDEKNLKLVNSTFSNKRIIKMSLGIMKQKLLRLFFTVFLTSFALSLFAVFVNVFIFKSSTLNTKVSTANSVLEYTITNTSCNVDDDKMSFTCDNLLLSTSDYTEVSDKVSEKVYKVYKLNNNGRILSLGFGENTEAIEMGYYLDAPKEFKFVDLDSDANIGEVFGRMPLNSGEIVISEFDADHILKFGIIAKNGSLYIPESLDNLVGDEVEVKLGLSNVKIVGVLMIPEKEKKLFEEAKEKGYFTNDKLYEYYVTYVSRNSGYIYSIGLVDNMFSEYDVSEKIKEVGPDLTIDYSEDYYEPYEKNNNAILTETIYYYNKSGLVPISSLEENQVIIEKNMFLTILQNRGLDIEKLVEDYVVAHPECSYDTAYDTVLTSYIGTTNITNEEIKLGNGRWIKLINSKSLKIVGVSMDNHNYLSEKILDNYYYIGKQNTEFKIFTKDSGVIKKLFNSFQVASKTQPPKSNPSYILHYVYDSWTDIDGFLKSVRGYVFIFVLVFGVFAALLIYNFIATTIKYSNKQIGILRALGTKNIDIVKIYGFESIVVSLVSWLVSLCFLLLENSLIDSMFFSLPYIDSLGIIVNPITIIIDILFVLIVSLSTIFVSISRISNVNPMKTILKK